MYINIVKVTEIFYLADEFCQEFSKRFEPYLIGNKPQKAPRMSDSEVITIMMVFILEALRISNTFIFFYLQTHLQGEFPKTVGYNCLVELSHRVCMPMILFLKTCCLGDCTEISFVDLTPVRACKDQRISRNNVFKGIDCIFLFP